MSREYGTKIIAGNVEPWMAAAIDARASFKTLEDMTAEGAFTSTDGFSYEYVGLIAVVTDDPLLGVAAYRLAALPTTDTQNWYRINTALTDSELKDEYDYETEIVNKPTIDGIELSGDIPSDALFPSVLTFEFADVLPEVNLAALNTIYVVPQPGEGTNGIRDEWLVQYDEEGQRYYDKVGAGAFSLDLYYHKADVDALSQFSGVSLACSHFGYVPRGTNLYGIKLQELVEMLFFAVVEPEVAEASATFEFDADTAMTGVPTEINYKVTYDPGSVTLDGVKQGTRNGDLGIYLAVDDESGTWEYSSAEVRTGSISITPGPVNTPTIVTAKAIALSYGDTVAAPLKSDGSASDIYPATPNIDMGSANFSVYPVGPVYVDGELIGVDQINTEDKYFEVLIPAGGTVLMETLFYDYPKSVQIFNGITGKFEWLGGDEDTSLDYFEITTTEDDYTSIVSMAGGAVYRVYYGGYISFYDTEYDEIANITTLSLSDRAVDALTAGEGSTVGEWTYGDPLPAFPEIAGSLSVANMFSGLDFITDLDISNWDKTSIVNVSGLFKGCSSLTTLKYKDLSFPEVLDASSMYEGCTKLANMTTTGAFNMPKVTNLSKMFYGCASVNLINTRYITTTNVTDFSYMFSGCLALTTIYPEYMDMSSAVNLAYMYQNLPKITEFDLSTWVCPNVTSMLYMFHNCTAATSINFSSLTVPIIDSMTACFYNCYKLTSIDFRSIEVSDVYVSSTWLNCGSIEFICTTANFAFLYALVNSSIMTYNIIDFYDETALAANAVEMTLTDSSLVTNEYFSTHPLPPIPWSEEFEYEDVTVSLIETFSNVPIVTLDLSLWTWPTETTLVRGAYMFKNNSSLITVVFPSDTWTFYDTTEMFNECTALESLDISSWVLQDCYAGSMFSGCSNLASLSLPGTMVLRSLTSMFLNCSSLAEIDTANIEYSDLVQTIYLDYVFAGCQLVTSLDIGRLITAKTVSITNLFKDCTSLASLSLASADLTNITTLDGFLMNCTSLREFDVRGVDITNVVSGEGMFNGCVTLKVYTDMSNYIFFEQYRVDRYTTLMHCDEAYYVFDNDDYDSLGRHLLRITTCRSYYSQFEEEEYYRIDAFWDSIVDTNGITSIPALPDIPEEYLALGIENTYVSIIQYMNMDYVDLSGWDTSKISVMYRFVQNQHITDWCYKVVDLTGWDYTNFTSFTAMTKQYRVDKYIHEPMIFDTEKLSEFSFYYSYNRPLLGDPVVYDFRGSNLPVEFYPDNSDMGWGIIVDDDIYEQVKDRMGGLTYTNLQYDSSEWSNAQNTSSGYLGLNISARLARAINCGFFADQPVPRPTDELVAEVYEQWGWVNSYSTFKFWCWSDLDAGSRLTTFVRDVDLSELGDLLFYTYAGELWQNLPGNLIFSEDFKPAETDANYNKFYYGATTYFPEFPGVLSREPISEDTPHVAVSSDIDALLSSSTIRDPVYAKIEVTNFCPSNAFSYITPYGDSPEDYTFKLDVDVIDNSTTEERYYNQVSKTYCQAYSHDDFKMKWYDEIGTKVSGMLYFVCYVDTPVTWTVDVQLPNVTTYITPLSVLSAPAGSTIVVKSLDISQPGLTMTSFFSMSSITTAITFDLRGCTFAAAESGYDYSGFGSSFVSSYGSKIKCLSSQYDALVTVYGVTSTDLIVDDDYE